MPLKKYYKPALRPTFASALADKHIKAARECRRMVKYYHSIGDDESSLRWRVVMLEKRRDAERVEATIWKNQRRAAHG